MRRSRKESAGTARIVQHVCVWSSTTVRRFQLKAGKPLRAPRLCRAVHAKPHTRLKVHQFTNSPGGIDIGVIGLLSDCEWLTNRLVCAEPESSVKTTGRSRWLEEGP